MPTSMLEILKNDEKVLTNHKQYDTMTQSASHAADFLVVTKISGGIKNPNRANIFINQKFDFSLDIAQLSDLKLKVGQTLSEPELINLRNLSALGKLYQRTLEWVLARPRSLKETRDYIKRKNCADPDPILKKLLEKNYLNDAKFAAYYLENRFVKKGISKKRLELELRQKGLDPDQISAALAASPRNNLEEIQKIILKKRPKYSDAKLYQYLLRLGFSRSDIEQALPDLSPFDNT